MPQKARSLITPPFLRAGDMVRLVAPSGAFERERLEAGLVTLRAHGLVPVYDEGLSARVRYLAGDDERRRAELLTALNDSNCKAIWAARGGYGATRLLPELDADIVRKAAKWLVGFSDITALHAVWTRAGVASIHGPNVTTVASWTAPAREELFSLLMEGESTQNGTHYACTPAFGKGSVTGWLFAGNITVLSSMVGTGTLPSLEGAIVVLEDVGEQPYRLDRMLTQLLQAKVFAGVRGFAIGQLTDCGVKSDEIGGYTALDVVLERLAGLGVPVVSNVAIGHESTSRALMLGAEGQIDLTAKLLIARLP